MKKLFALLGLMLITSVPLFSQLTWSNAIPSNPDFDSPTGMGQIEMYDGQVYHVFDSAYTYLQVSLYKTQTTQWKTLIKQSTSAPFYGLKTFRIGTAIYTVTTSYSGFDVYRYDIDLNQFTLISTGISTTSPSTDFEIIAAGNWMYLIYSDNGPSIFITQVNLTSGVYDTQGVNTQLNPGFQTGSYKYAMYMSSTTFYAALSGSDSRIGSCAIGSITGFTFYDGVSGQVKKNGTYLSTVDLQFTGDGQTAPYLIIHNPSNNSSYTKPLTTSTVDINTTTDTENVLNVSSTDNTAIFHPAYGFHVSPFSYAGTGSPNDLFYVNRFDNNTQTWDTIGPKIEFGSYGIYPYSLHASLDNGNKHMSVNYRDVNNGLHFKVLNNLPGVISASLTPNSSLCYGHQNLIFPEIQMYDDDNDPLTITYFYSSTGIFQNVQIVPIGIDNSVTPAIRKYAVYANVPNSGSDIITIYFSDGYNTYVLNLPQVAVTNAAPNLNFLTAPTVLCSNENMVSLQDQVNYYDGGTFFVNGQAISGTNINASALSITGTSGTLAYKTSIGGCIVETSGAYFIATPPTASATTIATSCGTNTGSATVSYTLGTYPISSVEWSTGETTPTINNLAPGAYYYSIVDAGNCHVTGFASVGMTGTSLNPVVTNVTCNGANNGSISLNITGMTNPYIVWSNGYSNTATQTNLAPGSYWVTVSDISGCQLTESFTITEPAPLTASFSDYEPDCGLSNGNIYGSYAGGTTPYTYSWLGTTQTTPDLTGVSYGTYNVVVTDNSGCSRTFSYHMDDYQAADIKDSVILAHCGKNDGAILVNFSADINGGTFPLSFDWSNGTETINNFNLTAGTYTITAYSGPSAFTNQLCVSTKTITVGTEKPLAQDICIVTVDTATTTNLVVWEKLELEGISHYNIYRENTTAGLFVQIDTVDFDNLSVFNDVIASPMDRSWRYRISAVNTCGIEGPISPIHKTLHLNAIVNLGNGSYDVLWDDYEGTQNVNAYVVWRHTDQLGWQAVSPAIPVGTSIYNDMPPVNSTGIDYYVEMSLIVPCSATKAQDFNTTRSNRERGQFAPGNGTGNSSNELGALTNLEVNLYPNPTTDNITLVTNTEINLPIRVLSVEGKVLLETTSEGITTLLNLDNLNQGLYLVEIKLGNKRIINQIVKR